MGTAYDDDVAAWAQEQVALLRAGQWGLLDVDHIAEEIEDMNISHRHQLAHRMAILMAHLLKWKYQPDRRGASWENTILNQRDRITRLLKMMPSLRRQLDKPGWDRDVWNDARDLAASETNLQDLPKTRCWDYELALTRGFFPEPENGGRQ